MKKKRIIHKKSSHVKWIRCSDCKLFPPPTRDEEGNTKKDYTRLTKIVKKVFHPIKPKKTIHKLMDKHSGEKRKWLSSTMYKEKGKVMVESRYAKKPKSFFDYSDKEKREILHKAAVEGQKEQDKLMTLHTADWEEALESAFEEGNFAMAVEIVKIALLSQRRELDKEWEKACRLYLQGAWNNQSDIQALSPEGKTIIWGGIFGKEITKELKKIKNALSCVRKGGI